MDLPTELGDEAADSPARIEVSVSHADEVALVEALRAGDQAAFELLIDRHATAMLRVARMYVSTAEAAEDVVQEAWLGVVRGVDRFEGRSSLKTWIFRILANRARTHGSRDGRTVPFSTLRADGDDQATRSVEPGRFKLDGRWAGYWAVPPALLPEDRVLGLELRATLDAMIDGLPARQRAVITLRDIEGFTAIEACEVLGLSDANQRVLLHRARCRVRAQLEALVGDGGPRQ